jgi:hypothetical protein
MRNLSPGAKVSFINSEKFTKAVRIAFIQNIIRFFSLLKHGVGLYFHIKS